MGRGACLGRVAARIAPVPVVVVLDVPAPIRVTPHSYLTCLRVQRRAHSTRQPSQTVNRSSGQTVKWSKAGVERWDGAEWYALARDESLDAANRTIGPIDELEHVGSDELHPLGNSFLVELFRKFSSLL